MSTDRCGCSNADEKLHRLTPPSHFLSAWFSVDLFILVSFHFLLCLSPFFTHVPTFHAFRCWWLMLFVRLMCFFLTTLDCGITALFDLSGSLLWSGPDVFLWSLWVSTLHKPRFLQCLQGDHCIEVSLIFIHFFSQYLQLFKLLNISTPVVLCYLSIIFVSSEKKSKRSSSSY